MKRMLAFTLTLLVVAASAPSVRGLSIALPRPEILFPKDYDTNRAEQVVSALRSDKFKYLGGSTSYWPPEFSTTLVYGGDARSLSAFLEALNQVKGVTVRLTFSADLARETGSALPAGSWWVKYSHTAPDTITVRINLVAEALGREKFELTLPKTKPRRGKDMVERAVAAPWRPMPNSNSYAPIQHRRSCRRWSGICCDGQTGRGEPWMTNPKR